MGKQGLALHHGAARRSGVLRKSTSEALVLNCSTDIASTPARSAAAQHKPRVVIVGAGFGGLSAATALKNAPVDLTVIDRRNHHLFQPLLYQVATASLPSTEIAWPIRAILRRQRNATVLMDDVIDVDTNAQEVQCETHSPVPYDILILATGVKHAYFGHEEWARHAPGLKDLNDAINLRCKILTAFERAESANDRNKQKRLLTFVVVGAGPTGVEMAGALADLAYRTLTTDFRHVNPDNARVILVEAGPRILTAFSEKCSAYAQRALQRLGVEVRVGEAVTDCSAEGVTLDQTFIPAATVIWAAGVQVPAVGQWLQCETDRAGRIVVDKNLSVPEQPNIFVIGDNAAVKDASDKPVPGIAPAAKQQGRYVAQRILSQLTRRKELGPFRYRHYGHLATIGRHAAIVDLGRIRFSGRRAWWVWGLTHIYFLVGVRARMLVALEWLWSHITAGKGARLIMKLSPSTDE